MIGKILFGGFAASLACYVLCQREICEREEKLDQTLMDSFPASDPPSH